MIITWLLPGTLVRPERKNALHRQMDFLESVIDDAESGEHIQVSFERHRYPDLAGTPIERFCYLAIAQGLALLPPLRELARQCKFQIEREREIEE